MPFIITTHFTDGDTEVRKQPAHTLPGSIADKLAPESVLSAMTPRCWEMD